MTNDCPSSIGQEQQMDTSEQLEADKAKTTTDLKCNECELKVTTESQLETHKRLKHIDVINYGCGKCTFN